MSDAPMRYRGRSIDDMSVEELRAALEECIRYTQTVMQMHQEYIALLRTTIDRDAQRQARLFVENAR